MVLTGIPHHDLLNQTMALPSLKKPENLEEELEEEKEQHLPSKCQQLILIWEVFILVWMSQEEQPRHQYLREPQKEIRYPLLKIPRIQVMWIKQAMNLPILKVLLKILIQRCLRLQDLLLHLVGEQISQVCLLKPYQKFYNM
ncbi:hypothetical protein BOKEGFJH_00002 [Chlamydia avium]|nr:hypothetical protein BOKEGFJH_00002 [Chlamydia avium]